ncbi:MAG: hypothetical protein CM1200mP3_07630 [Chloroflexota bacterium]|nr:MAG: hypothetical protein CM1200mP3_07630 [Chloroflexota bacterium]
MRTFHTGGVAGADITSGLPRVEELFEAGLQEDPLPFSEISGTASIVDTTEGRSIRVTNSEELVDEYTVSDYTPTVKNGSTVIIGTPIATADSDQNYGANNIC